MPQAALVAGIGAAASLGGGLLQSRGNNRAIDAQERAAREAMQFQRESEWRARMDARSQYDEWRRNFYGDQGGGRNGKGSGAGGTVPIASPGASAAFAPVGAQPAVMPTGAPVAAPDALPPALPVEAAPMTGAPPQQPQSLADVGPWSASNYGRYLGRR